MTTITPRRDTSYLDLLRAVAIIMVVNSHLDELYPIRQLGTGGMFGNELFFFISGYGLFLSYQQTQEPMISWLARRIVRVYEPLFIIASIFVLLGHIQIHTVSDFFWLYILPAQFWFLPSITAFYLPLYFILSFVTAKKTFIYLLLALGIVYILVFSLFAEKTAWITEIFEVQTAVTLPMRLIYYFSTMLIGVYMARFHAKMTGNGYDFLWLLLSAAAYYLFVASLGRLIPFQLQIIDRIPALAFLFFAYRLARYPGIEKFISNNLSGAVALFGGLSLQIYLIHAYVLDQETLKSIAFPANIVVFTIATLALSVLFEKISFRRPRRDRRVNPTESSMPAQS